MSAPDAVVHLIRFRAAIVRLAIEAEFLADHMTGKGAPRARAAAAELARKMRDAAMSGELVEACKR